MIATAQILFSRKSKSGFGTSPTRKSNSSSKERAVVSESDACRGCVCEWECGGVRHTYLPWRCDRFPSTDIDIVSGVHDLRGRRRFGALDIPHL